MSNPANCPFCRLPQERIILQNDLALAIRDGLPRRRHGQTSEATAEPEIYRSVTTGEALGQRHFGNQRTKAFPAVQSTHPN